MMTRKSAILAMLAAPLAVAQSTLVPQSKDDPQGFKFTFDHAFDPTGSFTTATGIMARVTTLEIEDSLPADHIMLRVTGDGRVAELTVKEIMDALGGKPKGDAK